MVLCVVVELRACQCSFLVQRCVLSHLRGGTTRLLAFFFLREESDGVQRLILFSLLVFSCGEMRIRVFIRFVVGGYLDV